MDEAYHPTRADILDHLEHAERSIQRSGEPHLPEDRLDVALVDRALVLDHR
jgi:hypothetical protein